MDYLEFKKLESEEKAVLRMDAGTAVRYVKEASRFYQFLHVLASLAWLSSIPASFITVFVYRWWVGFLLLFLGTPVLARLARWTALEGVLSQAQRESSLFTRLTSEGVLTVVLTKPRD